jgi:hypothetical protein
MSERILFQQDRLTVSDRKIIVGNATVFYPSVSATSIYEGRPFFALGVMGIVGLLPVGVISLMGARLLGPYFPMKLVALMFIPTIGMAIFGFTYQVKCLFMGVDGSSVAVLKSKERFELEVAQRAIEEAKRAYEADEKKA